jgi:fermentation-respiration switch protein FrsA (DUF1100 family)
MAMFARVIRRASIGIFAVGVAGYLGLLGILYFGQRGALYHPTDIVPEPAAFGVPEMTAHRVDSQGGARPLIWWTPPKNSSYPVIVYYHGNGGHLGGRGRRTRIYLEAGYGLLLAGYRYNAGAGGAASEEGLLADGRAAVAFAQARGYEPERMVFYGESLGSGVATAMAAEYGASALILEMAYSSVADVAQHHYWYLPARWLVKDSFDSAARMQLVRAPVLIVHGENDRTIPAWSARKLLEAAAEPKEGHFLPAGNHGNLYRLGAGDLVLDFLVRHVLPEQETAAGG